MNSYESYPDDTCLDDESRMLLNKDSSKECAFVVCTSLQLISAVALRRQLSLQSEKCCLFILNEFPRAREAADTMAESSEFGEVIFVESEVPKKWHQIRTYFSFIFRKKSKRVGYVHRFGERATKYHFKELYAANPRTLIEIRRFSASKDNTVILFDEGLGSHTTSIEDFFCVKTKMRVRRKKQMSVSASIKSMIKRVLEALDFTDFFMDPLCMYVIPSSESITTLDGSIERKPLAINLAHDIRDFGGYFDCPSYTIYSRSNAVFLGVWSSVVDEEEQLNLARLAKEEEDSLVVFRPHPRTGFDLASIDDLVVDRTYDSWEMLCISGAITSESILIGYGSTAQVLPYLLANAQPFVVLLPYLITEESDLRDGLISASKHIATIYQNSNRVFIPESYDEYKACLMRIFGGDTL